MADYALSVLDVNTSFLLKQLLKHLDAMTPDDADLSSQVQDIRGRFASPVANMPFVLYRRPYDLPLECFRVVDQGPLESVILLLFADDDGDDDDDSHYLFAWRRNFLSLMDNAEVLQRVDMGNFGRRRPIPSGSGRVVSKTPGMVSGLALARFWVSSYVRKRLS